MQQDSQDSQSSQIYNNNSSTQSIFEQRKQQQISKIYHIYRINKSTTIDHIIETYSKVPITKNDLRNIRARQKDLISNPKFQSLEGDKMYCLSNYPNNILSYMKEYGDIYGVPRIQITKERGVEINPKVIVKFDAKSTSSLAYLRENMNNNSVIKDFLIKISESFDGLAEFGYCALKRCLSNLRIKKHEGQVIEVKNYDFTHTLMLRNQRDGRTQKQLLKYLQQIFESEIQRKDFCQVLKELYQGNLRSLSKFYDIYYFQIIKQIIEIYMRKQELNKDQQQMVELLKSYRCIGEDARNNFIQKLKEQHEINENKNISSSQFNNSIRNNIFTQQSLRKIFKDNFRGVISQSFYKYDVIDPILYSQKKNRMDIPKEQLTRMKKVIQKIEEIIQEVDTTDEKLELLDMIQLIGWQINQKDSKDKKSRIVQSIKEKSTKNMSRQIKEYYEKREQQLRINNNNNVLSQSMLSNSISLQSRQYRRRLDNQEQVQTKRFILKRPQNKCNIEDQFINLEVEKEQSMNESFFQDIALQEAQSYSISTFQANLAKDSTLDKLEYQDDKMKQLHNRLSEGGFQGTKTFQLIRAMNFIGIDKNEQLIYRALQERYEKIQEYMLEQTKLLKIMKSHNYENKNPISQAKSLFLVMDHYFKHQYEKGNDLDKIFKDHDQIVFGPKKCRRLIEEVQELIKEQKCFVYRKFKEQIILKVFGNPKYLENLSQSQSSRASPQKGTNLTGTSPQRQRSQQSINIYPTNQRFQRQYVRELNSQISNRY